MRNNTFAWKTKDNKNFSFSTDNKYFAYYPYKSDAQKVDPSALDASTFFASKISSLSPASDQSTQNTLLDQDFQVAKGVVASDASTLTFLMEHAMGLAEITLGAKTFDNNYYLSNYTSYTWKNGTTTFHAYAGISGYSFYKVADYRYVALVKPDITTDFSCGSTTDADSWTGNVSVKPAANNVDRVTVTSKRTSWPDISYTMEVGDIYYSDGAMTHQSEDLASGKTPIGIVGYTGNNYWTETQLKSSNQGGHALVMCLKTIGSTETTGMGDCFVWYSSKTSADRTKINSKALLIGSCNQPYGSGVTETNALISKWSTAAEAAYQAKNYTTLPASSSKCSGWFLPTAGQYYAVMSTLGATFSDDWTGIYGDDASGSSLGFFNNMTTVTSNINNKLKKVGDNNYTEFFCATNTWTWTSSEFSDINAVILDSGCDDKKGPGSVRFYGFEKTACYRVRPFLAF